MFFLAFAAAQALPAPIPAQPVGPPSAAVGSIPAPGTLIAGTNIEFEFTQAASSRTNKSGDMIALRTLNDVRGFHNEILIPSGSPAVAEIIQASPARMMGKAGELTFAARYVEVGGQKIPLKRFRFGSASGKDNTGATFVATALIGLPGMLISGGNVDIAVGARANAVVISETNFAQPTSAESNQPAGGN
jgi:hypothetical protein